MSVYRAAPDISSRASFFKSQGHRGQRSNFCISAVLGSICMKLGECIQVDPDEDLWVQLDQRSSRPKSNLWVFFCWSCIFLFVPLLLPGPWADLHQTSGYYLEGFIFKGQGHRGQRSNFCISAVLGPICMKLGECIQVDP